MILRNILSAILVIACSVILGALGSNYILNHFEGFGRMRIGKWLAYPEAGTLQADAYARARAAKRGDIALGRAEGLMFQTWQDERGRPLRSQCDYELHGELPEARFFTLYPVNNRLEPMKPSSGLPGEIYSRDIIRDSDGKNLTINLSAKARSGNWLATPHKGEYGLVLTLYDTPIAASTAMQKLVMPNIHPVANGVRECE